MIGPSLADFRIGECLFSVALREVRGSRGVVTLSPTETHFLITLCTYSGRLLSAEELFREVWPEEARRNLPKGWRNRVDSQLRNLRGKLQDILPNSIFNQKGEGFRLSVVVENVAPVRGETAGTIATVTYDHLLHELSSLQPPCHIVVKSACPFEARPEGATYFVDALRNGITFEFVLTEDVEVAAALLQGLLDSKATPAVSTGRPRTLISGMRLIFSDQAIPDSKYVIAANRSFDAKYYYCLDQDRRAVLLKERQLASAHAKELVPSGHNGAPDLLSCAPGVREPEALIEDLRSLVSRRLGPAGIGLFETLVTPRKSAAREQVSAVTARPRTKGSLH
ncbi:MAG: helix-turn-helix domain-containing protein [Chrysiogenetes bacterium]|nr:helix-turn-helix domain-containing protein [Chrysiogenetes bacterium]